MATPPSSMSPLPTSARQAWASGLALFAGTMMILIGTMAALLGISGIARDTVLLAVSGYLYSLDLTVWGWIHLILGVLVVGTGVGLLTGREWAQPVGIVLVSLNLLTNFLFLPYSPWWSLMIGALDVAVIWALATYRPPRRLG